LRVAAHEREERATVARIVDGAEARRRGDALRGDVVIEVAMRDAAARRARRGDHALVRVDAAVREPRGEEVGEASVAAGKVEEGVALAQLRPDPQDRLRAVREVRGGIGVRALGPALALRVVLLCRLHRSASRRSGCLRRKRTIALRCHQFRRVKKRLSITAWYSWWTTASGTHQRSQPAFIAR